MCGKWTNEQLQEFQLAKFNMVERLKVLKVVLSHHDFNSDIFSADLNSILGAGVDGELIALGLCANEDLSAGFIRMHLRRVNMLCQLVESAKDVQRKYSTLWF